MRSLLFMILGAFAAAAQVPRLPSDYAARVAELERSYKAHPADLGVVDALSGSYAMGGQYEKAIRVLQETVALHPPNSAELELKLARNQSWAGHTGRAISSYEAYLKARPQDRIATIELIRLRRYRGDYSRAEKLCDRLLRTHPDDAEVLALKAEVLHWAGNRRFLARRTADRAAQLAPDSPDAKVSQVYALRDLGENRSAQREFGVLENQVARRGGVDAQSTFGDAYKLLESYLAHPARMVDTPAYSVYNDSDAIRNVFSGLRVAVPFRDDHQWLLDLSHYRSSAPLSSVFTRGRDRSSVSEFLAGATFRAAPAVRVTLLGGASRRSSLGELRPAFDFQVLASPADRWTFDFSSGREFLKATPRAIDLNISSYKVAGGAQYAFDSRTSLAVHADRRYWSDDNRSLAGEAVLRRVLHYYKPFMVDAGALTRWEKFDRDTRFASGFFTPDQYRRHDGFLGLHGELGKWMSYELRGAAGAQRVARAADYRRDWELASTAEIRISRSLRLSATYQRRNYSLLSREGWYQGFYVSLGIRP